ncbi:hypothetical protein [Glycomyces sp. NRRL B-16210]|uniref:hypothetical protein n=1 Tax=Glycomyces sp. NRRL B-16210 TaxID=1463821 RepID=UPI0004C03A6B|nr:hypothetical protein [Glycomyces sp. NRRL B-16210]
MVRGISTAITVRRAAAIAIAGVVAAALSACGAGQVTQTDSKHSAIAGVNVQDGDLALRDLQIEFDTPAGYAAGESAALRVWIANEGEAELSLVGVTVRANQDDPPEALAGIVTLVGAEAEAPESPSEEPSDEPTDGEDAEGEDGEDGGENTDEEGTPSDDATTEAPEPENPFAGALEYDVPIAPHGYVRLDQGVEGGDHLLIEGLGGELKVGGHLWVTFYFSNGQEVEVKLPIGQSLDAEDRSYYEPEDAGGH